VVVLFGIAALAGAYFAATRSAGAKRAKFERLTFRRRGALPRRTGADDLSLSCERRGLIFDESAVGRREIIEKFGSEIFRTEERKEMCELEFLDRPTWPSS
jgi:hypothetical protein